MRLAITVRVLYLGGAGLPPARAPSNFPPAGWDDGGAAACEEVWCGVGEGEEAEIRGGRNYS
jgi:hypothetical protein